MAPPAESPVTKTRAGSSPCARIMWATIWRIDSASPASRAVSPGSNQLKQRLGLLARRCSGASSAKPARSAIADQPLPAS